MGPSAVSLPCRALQPRTSKSPFGDPVRRGTGCSPTRAKTPVRFPTKGRPPQPDCPPPHRRVRSSKAEPHRTAIPTGLERLKFIFTPRCTAPHRNAPCRSLPLWARGEVFDTPPEDGRLAIQRTSLMTAVTTQFGQRHHTARPPAPLSLLRGQPPTSFLSSTCPPRQATRHAPTELPSSTVEARASCLPQYGPRRARASSTWLLPDPTPSQSQPRRARKRKTATPAATRRATTSDRRALPATTTTSPMARTPQTLRKPQPGRGSRHS